jgi:anti-sigma regulatory factor (Ser/Thr protein kinase)
VSDIHSFSFPREPDSVPAARAELARFDDELPGRVLYDAALCLSELVTNAVQHPAPESGDELELLLQLTPDALRVRVIDPGGDFEPGPPTQGSERGWGLYIVDQLATRWGTEPGEQTVIWFEIARGEPRAQRAGHEWTNEPADSRDRRGDELAHAVGHLRPRLAIQ